jgi:hypothetical protein
MNKYELYFESIETIEDLNNAEKEGFSIFFKTSSMEMPGANLLHQASRKCCVPLLEYLIFVKKMDINALDLDYCTALGYVVNDDLWHDTKGASTNITTVNNGCEDAIQILGTIEFLIANGAKCIYNGESYSDSWIKNYISNLKKII